MNATCFNCGETSKLFDVGSDPTCGACYASAIGHGSVPECRRAAVDLIEETCGTMTPAMDGALSYYYGAPCKAGCEHELFY